MRLGMEETVEIAVKLTGSLKIQNEIEFSDGNGKAPDINFYPDNDLYFDSGKNDIHLGVFGIVDIFDVQTEEEFVRAINYARGHESQHKRSTAALPYQWGIHRGIETVLEYISGKEEKSKRRFRSESDYRDFANRVLPSMGIYISYNMMESIIGGIANSLEDGRIERIRSARFPGFEKMRIFFRGRFWMTQERMYRPYEEISGNAPEKLSVIMDQVLSLATCQLYAKGFAAAYAGTPFMDEVRGLMPYIAKGILAGRTREMAFQVVEIAEKLAPFIYDSCRISQKDMEARARMMKMLLDIGKSMKNGNPDTGTSEAEEDTDDGGGCFVFPDSDLAESLKEKTPDQKSKSKEKMKTDGQSSSFENRPQPMETDSAEKGRGSEENRENQRTAPDKNSRRVDTVEKAVKEAEEITDEMAEKQMENIRRSDAHEKKAVCKVVRNTDKIITAEDVKGICPQFKEIRRMYRLKEKLPSELALRGRTLYRKNLRYFRSLSTPNLSYLDSGSVDPSRIYGLSFGETDVFRKKGIDRKFDGCVYILIDNSGSMAGEKRREACKAAALVEESFRGLIPIKIVAFDYQNGSGVIHEVIKGWKEQERYNCCWNFCMNGRSGYGNADGYDILIAQKELLARPEAKKLLIVLSDGMPSEASEGFTKGAIEETRRRGIQVFGIYFEEGDEILGAGPFKEMYGHKDAVACSLSELDENLERICKKFSRS